MSGASDAEGASMALTRKTLLQSTFLVLTSTALGAGFTSALAQTAAPASGSADTINLTLPPVTVIARQLDAARSELEPSLGATKYNFSPQTLARLPQADSAPLNQVLLQAPGVAQDSYGQIHVRGDHDEVQYRLDGVELPEGLSVFGQALETRFAHSMSLITGALPAQYGFLQAGVVNIQTKSGTTDPGGEISMEGGSRGYLQPTFSYGGTYGRTDYFFTGDFLRNPVGIENPTGSFNASHDVSNQYHFLGHISTILNPTTRVSLIVGVSNEQFQIPNTPGQTPTLGLTVNGVSTYNSSDLNDYQREITDFGILSLQKQFAAVNMQISAFTRFSSLNYTPDPIGDLLFNGIAQTAARSIWSNGVQSDASWRVNDAHTIRAGFQFEVDHTDVTTSSSVLPVNDQGQQIPGSQPFTIPYGSSVAGTLYGLYLQDEWKILPRVTLNYGVRFDGVNEYTSATQLSPRVNVVWRPTDTTTLHAGYSRYFTPPPFELVGANQVAAFQNTSAGPYVTGNSTQDSTVKAERDNYYDAGITQVLMPGLQVGLDAYFKQATDLIDEGQFGAPVILTAYNYAQGQDSGIELSGSYDRGPWSIYGNLAYSRAIGKGINTAQFNFTTQALAYSASHWIYLDHDQRWTGSGGVAYTLNRTSPNSTLFSADLVYGSGLRTDAQEGAVDVPNGMEMPSYYTINGSIVQQLNFAGWHGASIRLDVINLLDRTYALRSGTGVGVYAPQYGLRRTILVGMSQRF
jgi:outer membrane receptor protein involved in Fe transport